MFLRAKMRPHDLQFLSRVREHPQFCVEDQFVKELITTATITITTIIIIVGGYFNRSTQGQLSYLGLSCPIGAPISNTQVLTPYQKEGILRRESHPATLPKTPTAKLTKRHAKAARTRRAKLIQPMQRSCNTPRDTRQKEDD